MCNCVASGCCVSCLSFLLGSNSCLFVALDGFPSCKIKHHHQQEIVFTRWKSAASKVRLSDGHLADLASGLRVGVAGVGWIDRVGGFGGTTLQASFERKNGIAQKKIYRHFGCHVNLH